MFVYCAKLEGVSAKNVFLFGSLNFKNFYSAPISRKVLSENIGDSRENQNYRQASILQKWPETLLKLVPI